MSRSNPTSPSKTDSLNVSGSLPNRLARLGGDDFVTERDVSRTLPNDSPISINTPPQEFRSYRDLREELSSLRRSVLLFSEAASDVDHSSRSFGNLRTHPLANGLLRFQFRCVRKSFCRKRMDSDTRITPAGFF